MRGKHITLVFAAFGVLGVAVLGLLTAGHASAAPAAQTQLTKTATAHPPAGKHPTAAKPAAGTKQGAGPAGFGGFGPHRGGVLQGTIQSVSNGTLTLAGVRKNSTATVAVQTTAGTIVLKNGLVTVADLKVGDKVQILEQFAPRPTGTTKPTPGTTPQATARTAAVVYVPGANDALISARVQAVSGDTLTLRAPHNSSGKAITVNANTSYNRLGTNGAAPSAAGLSDVKAGTEVLIYGTKSAQGQISTADVVLILPPGQK